MLLPWSTPVLPEGVISPSQTGDGRLERSQVRRALRAPMKFLVPGTLDTLEEWTAVERILPDICGENAMGIFVNLILPTDLQLTQEENNRIFVRYHRLLELGVDEVMFDAPRDPRELGNRMRLSQRVLDLNVRRMESMLEVEGEPVTSDDLVRRRSFHRHLLWESIPRALMPDFPAVDMNLAEGPHNVDRYRLIRRLDSTSGKVVLAVVEENWKAYAIKVTTKDTVRVVGDLECIYREFRFVSSIIQHPHVVRCVEMLHSPSRLHMVFDLAGNMNLAQMLDSCPGQRASEREALEIFGQIGGAVAYCHSRDVSHRQLSLEHIVLRQIGPGRYHSTLVDFNKAMLARSATTSATVCGEMPCIAPEVLVGRTYVPWRADCWSMGVVLLEMAGGKGSMNLFLGCDDEGAETRPRIVANKEHEMFAVTGSQAAALARMGAVESQAISSRLELLLRPAPVERAPMRAALNGLRHDQA